MIVELLSILGLLILLGTAIASLLVSYRRRWQKYKALNLVFLQVLIPKKDSKQEGDADAEQFGSAKDFVKLSGLMTQLVASLHSLRTIGWKTWFQGRDFFTLEYTAHRGQILWHIGVPRAARSLAEKQISSFYPDAVIERSEVPNIFPESAEVMSQTLHLDNAFHLPLRTSARLESDSLNNITNALSKLGTSTNAAIQIHCTPVPNTWQKVATEAAEEMHANKKDDKPSWLQRLNPFRALWSLILLLVQGPQDSSESPKEPPAAITPMVQERVKLIEEKASKVGFQTEIRIVVASEDEDEAEVALGSLLSSFEQFGSPDTNSLSPGNWKPTRITPAYVFRSPIRSWWQSAREMIRGDLPPMILSSEEVSSLYHFPNARFNTAPSIKWQEFKIAPAPHNLPDEGLLLGNNIFRGEERPVRIKRDDRRRHFYAIGKSGTGKSTILEYMIRQDIQNGEGVCVIDPHGDLVEAVLPYVPRHRADDVVLFDPGDLGRPMGLNILEAETEAQREFISQEALAIFIKLYGEEIMGPRLQHYFRNGILTLMSDPEEGATLLDIMRVFTDELYSQRKQKHVTNPSVRSFWDREMAKSGAREKEEIIPYFASKFGPFVTNAQIRNILGQEKSGFDFRDVMDGQKILLVNLSKGKLGDLNSKLLGMIMVSKLQMAAMSRVDTPEHERKDFYLYVDEFQNFVTDSFASILSEARKYRLCLVVAHQYISQITKTSEGGRGKQEDHTLKDAVFGNVGSMMCFKIGSQDAEVMEKEFGPVFNATDLINIANYQAYIKLNIDNATSRGFSMKTIYDPSGADREGAEAFRQLSRLKFGRDQEFVNREIARRLV